MGVREATLESGADETRKPSFKARFLAWWEGYELPEPEPQPESPMHRPFPNLAMPEPPPAAIAPLDHATVRIAQQIWGEGFSRPGAEAAILTLVKPFALDPSMTVMDFGAGLGGGTRAVSNEFGVWVYGFEPDPLMA